ncbi:MAG: hypothetical protein IKR50_04265 [Prevotella sp.]|nr:hypothetical protein [Prevotella sp.]
MKKLSAIFAFLLATIGATAGDFKLYMANNAADLNDFNKIEFANKTLNWRLVESGDVDGNSYETDRVRQMLASQAMKGLAQQQQFWTMRDHTLLCFHISDDSASADSYEVEVEESDSGEKQVLTVSSYFFVNLPLVSPPSTEYVITVTRVYDRTQQKRFKYTVFDWDNANVYIFQLDRKRQLTGNSYSMEYVTGYMDEDGLTHSDTTQLQLQAKSFQSFYVPKGHDILDVVLIGDENKLRINKKRLHPGVDLEDRFTRMRLSPTFSLDRHKDREFINFNWLGTGLFEKYDTLYLSLFDYRGNPIPSATIHIDQVDANGEPTHSKSVKYLGFDRKSSVHKVLTMGKPAYIEILAKGFLPVMYKYAGAADDETGFVSEDRCMATITLKKGRFNDDDGIVVSESAFLNLNDEKAIVVRNRIDHELCTVDEVDLAAKNAVDTVTYYEDCGMDYPKLLDNKAIDRYAQIQANFSRPKGGTIPDCFLYATNLTTKSTTEAKDKKVLVYSANKYTSFSRDYYSVRFNLVDVIESNTMARLKLTAGNMAYDEFPTFFNMKANREDDNKSAEKEINDNMTGSSKEDDEKVAGGFASSGFDLKLPVQFKFNIKPVMITTSAEADFRKQIISFKVNVAVGRDTLQRENETKEMSKARQELKAKEKYENTFYDVNKKVGQSFIGDKVKLRDKEDNFKDWVYSQTSEVFDMSSSHVGQGWFGGGKFELKCRIADKKRYFQLTNLSGFFGYGLGLSTTDLGGATSKIAEVFNKLSKYTNIKLCGAFEVSSQVDLGLKTFDKTVKDNWNSQNQGYFFRLGAKCRASATLSLSTPSFMNSVVNIQAGLRVGGKVGVQFGLEGPFSDEKPGVGLELSGVAMGQAFFDLRTFIFHWSGQAGFAFGAQGLIPDSDHNPFHSDFPYWIPKSKARPVGKVFKAEEAPVASTFGKVLVNNIAIDANPHFLDEDHIVFNDLRTPGNYDDDQVSLVALSDTLTSQASLPATRLSTPGTTAANHMRSKRGNHEIVVYEQMMSTVGTPDEKNAVDFNSEVMKLSRIRASILKGGQWEQTAISDSDLPDDYADLKPVVTIQDDGHAACIYQHGQISLSPTNGAEVQELDNINFNGHLVLKTYDGKAWSKPTPLFDINNTQHVGQYDLIMRNDTVLVASIIQKAGADKPTMRYASKPLNTDAVSYEDEPISPVNFFMNRVGQNGVIAMLYEKSDSIRDIYVKTLDMDGTSDGRAGADVGVGYCMPSKVKIVCDREASNLDDFALLWTESNNAATNDDGSSIDTGWTGLKLNASRIHLTNAPQITAPITVGAEVDSLRVMTDFDGFLDDSHISAVYTLANPKTGAGVIMHNDKYFRNSFEYEVGYGRESLMGSPTLPVNVEVRNTGTSAIQTVHVNINGEMFDIDESYVAPRHVKTFVVQYPIGEDFDGFISSKVTVDYNNVFRARRHPRFRAMSFLSQTHEKPLQRVIFEIVEAKLISRDIEDGVNTFVVELIDHRGLNDDSGVHVGIYANPAGTDPIADDAEVLVRPTDFVQVAGQRKAWATISVSGIAEPTLAYINCHVMDMNHTDEDDGEVVVENVFPDGNAHLVQLFPTSDPGELTRILATPNDERHNTVAESTTAGITLNGLQPGECVRVYTLDGVCVCRKNATSSTLFVPLRQQGVYIISAGHEVFKYQF